MSQFNVDHEISLEEASQLFDSVTGRVYKQLSQRGFAASQIPMIASEKGGTQPYNGYLPPDLTALTDDQLGWYLGMISTWLDYVQQQYAEAHAAMSTAEQKLKFIEAKLYMIYKKDEAEGKKRPEPERKMLVLADRRYVESQSEALYYETFYRYVKAIAGSAEQNYTAVSRRISQRQQDIERGKRTTGVSGHTAPFFARTT